MSDQRDYTTENLRAQIAACRMANKGNERRAARWKSRAEAAEQKLRELQTEHEISMVRHADALMKLADDGIRLVDENDRLNRELAELQERTRWIPVGERLPEGLKVVAFYDSISNVVRTGWHVGSIEQWVTVSDLFFHGNEYRWITHWQPLPEPPEAENE